MVDECVGIFSQSEYLLKNTLMVLCLKFQVGIPPLHPPCQSAWVHILKIHS